MDAQGLSGAEITRRTAAIARLQAVALEMRHFAVRLLDTSDEPTIAQSPLALAARAGWVRAQAALIQAEGGIASLGMIDAIAEPGIVDSPALRGLSLSTLMAAEARLTGKPPMPAAIALGGGR
jgi:hypothetical protein